jgi:hypothetical protein
MSTPVQFGTIMPPIGLLGQRKKYHKTRKRCTEPNFLGNPYWYCRRWRRNLTCTAIVCHQQNTLSMDEDCWTAQDSRNSVDMEICPQVADTSNLLDSRREMLN